MRFNVPTTQLNFQTIRFIFPTIRFNFPTIQFNVPTTPLNLPTIQLNVPSIRFNRPTIQCNFQQSGHACPTTTVWTRIIRVVAMASAIAFRIWREWSQGRSPCFFSRTQDYQHPTAADCTKRGHCIQWSVNVPFVCFTHIITSNSYTCAYWLLVYALQLMYKTNATTNKKKNHIHRLPVQQQASQMFTIWMCPGDW